MSVATTRSSDPAPQLGVGLLAPWLSTTNLGNRVIADSIYAALARVGIRPTMEFGTFRRSPVANLWRELRDVGPVIAGGTSILSPRMERWWPFWATPEVAHFLRGRVILMGVGWARYSDKTSAYTRWVLNKMLDPDAIHSVRDSYTAERLAEIGIKTVVTSCPTLWDIHTWQAHHGRASRLILTVTDYNKDPMRDAAWISRVRATGIPVTFQPMSAEDNAYLIGELGVDPTEVALPTLAELNRALREEGTSMIGTRLHAGIRGLQHGRAAAIFALDNRAIEMAKDARLPVYGFDDVDNWLAPATGGNGPATPVEPLTDDIGIAIKTFLGQFAT